MGRARNTFARVAALVLSLAGAAVAQPVIEKDGVLNAASLMPPSLPCGSIAPGSIVAIRGAGLGPEEGIADTRPAPELGGAMVRLRRGERVWAAPLTLASGREIRAVIPRNLLPGSAEISVVLQGVESNRLPIVLSPYGFGIFTVNGRGVGPAIENVVQPGERVIITGTGLGGTMTQPRAEVFVAGERARVLRAVPRDGEPGVDEIEFVVPDSAPRECCVPIQVRLDGTVPSNVAMLAVDPDPRECMKLDRTRRYLSRGGMVGFVVPFHQSMRYDGDPFRDSEFNGDALVALFQHVETSDRLASRFYPPAVGSCAVLAEPLALSELLDSVNQGTLRSVDRLEAGELRVGVDGEELIVPPPKKGQTAYYPPLAGSMPNDAAPARHEFLRPGKVRVSATEGAEVGEFSIDVCVPGWVRWTNREKVTAVNCDRDLTVEWKTPEPRQALAVVGVSTDYEARTTAGFVCLLDGAAGRFRIPAPVLQSLRPSRRPEHGVGGYLFLGTLPLCKEHIFHASGLETLFGLGVSVDGRTVRYR